MAPEADAVMKALFGVEDSVLAYLPLRCVVLLARCAINPVKMQAAKSLHAIAKNYATGAPLPPPGPLQALFGHPSVHMLSTWH